ncbi:MAG: conjugal transfer protein TraG N-terminal domain-containing protein [Bacteroidota bacterium]
MDFDIYTVGAGFFLEKILNAIRFIIGDGGFVTALKTVALGSLTLVSSRMAQGSHFRDTYTYLVSLILVISVFMSGTATVRTHDHLRDSYGGLPAVRVVKGVPWGLAFFGSLASGLGYTISEKFEDGFGAVFANPTYGKTGMMFGSKIVEDANDYKINDPQITKLVGDFYKACIVPDVRMGMGRKNGYTIRDLAKADDILGFLKSRSSKVRRMQFVGTISKVTNNGFLGTSSVEENKISEYVTCKQAAHYISDMLDYEIKQNMPILASSFFSVFFPNKGTADHNAVFESVLADSYGLFVKNSKDAKDLLTQSVMINSLKNAVSINSSYSSVATNKLTQSAYYSIAQLGQRYVPLLLGILEALVYGSFPLVLILAFTPFAVQFLKNYAKSFIYLQLWQPTYVIIFCLASYWGQFQSVDNLTYISHKKISTVSAEMSMIAGYMLMLVPVLAGMILSGLGSSIGSLATSMFHIPQNAAMQSAEASVKGNYNIGNTSVDNHSYGNTSANKFDDSHSMKTGLVEHVTGSGVKVTKYADGSSTMQIPTHQMGGLAEAETQKRTGQAFNDIKSKAQNETERWGTSAVEHTSAALSKLLGYDKSANLNTHAGTDWRNTMSSSEKEAYDNIESTTDALSKRWGLDKSSAMRLAVAASAGIGIPKGLKFISAGISATGEVSKRQSEQNAYNDAVNIAEDKKLSKSFDVFSNFARSQNFGTQKGLNQNAINSIKEDFGKGYTASLNYGKSVENLNSIQEQESYFKEMSLNTRTSLNYPLGEWGKNKFGEEQFATLLKSSPAKAQGLVAQFVQENRATLFTPSKPSYTRKSNQEIANQFAQEHRTNEDKGHQFATKTMNEEATKEESKLKDLKQQMENRVGLRDMVIRQVKLQGKERIEHYDDNIRKHKRLIQNEREKQTDRYDNMKDEINDKRGTPTEGKAWRETKKSINKGARMANEAVRSLTGDPITRFKREKAVWDATKGFKEDE